MSHFNSLEQQAADRNNLPLETYREKVREFAAYVAAILLRKQASEDTNHVLPTLKDPIEERSTET